MEPDLTSPQTFVDSSALVGKPQFMPLLLCTNGCPTTRPALDYGVHLAGVLHTPVVLLGVVETPGQKDAVEQLLQETAERLAIVGVSFGISVDQGRGTLVIARYAHSGPFLTVVGPLGRPAWRRMIQGRSFRRLLEKIETPLLYVPTARLPIRKILVCTGGLGYAEGVEHLALHLAAATGASLTLLHVVEPVNLDYPVARQVQEHWKDIDQTDTPQGRNLRQALEQARIAGLSEQLKIRHGSPVHEIIEEAQSGKYDLIGMGSPYSAHSLRHLYLPNVTAEVAETLHLPVLAVRQGHELVP
jgi:nucleotide-binding universal stress UspA family protein